MSKAPVYVVGVVENNVASAALSCEGVEHSVLICRPGEPYDYAEHLARVWRAGSGFVMVEDDVVPWPGAVGELAGCQEPWCGFRYHWGSGAVLGGSLGCWGVSAALTRHHPDLPDAWHHEWWCLDGAVVRSLVEVAAYEGDDPAQIAFGFHIHNPPVAHAIHFGRER